MVKDLLYVLGLKKNKFFSAIFGLFLFLILLPAKEYTYHLV